MQLCFASIRTTWTRTTSAMAQITNFILQMTLLVIQQTATFGSLESRNPIKILHYDC